MPRKQVSASTALLILALALVTGALLGSTLRECTSRANAGEPSFGESLRRMAEALEGIRTEMRRLK